MVNINGGTSSGWLEISSNSFIRSINNINDNFENKNQEGIPTNANLTDDRYLIVE